MSTSTGVVVLHVGQEGDSWYAQGWSDGSAYLAVADTRTELNARIRESAESEGWLGWVVISSGAIRQWSVA